MILLLKEEIKNKIRNVKSLEDKEILLELFEQVFEDLIDYQEEKNKQLREQLTEELEIRQNDYVVATTLLSKNEWMESLDYEPVLLEELQEQVTDWERVKVSLQANLVVKIGKVFAKVSKDINNLWKENPPEFDGVMVTSKRRVPVKICLRNDERYWEIKDNVEQAFFKNGINCRRIPELYFSRFYEVCITECSYAIYDDEAIKSIEIDYGLYSENVLEDKLLVWNLKAMEKKVMGFPVPQYEQKKYQFMIECDRENELYVVLLDQEEYAVHKNKSIDIYSDDGNMRNWHCYKICEQDRMKPLREYPVVSNYYREDFCDRFAAQYLTTVATKGEWNRMVQQMEVERYITLENIKKNKSEKNEMQIRLEFASTGEETWLIQDLVEYVEKNLQDNFQLLEIICTVQ